MAKGKYGVRLGKKGTKSLPPRKGGKGKIVKSNSMAHGGNC